MIRSIVLDLVVAQVFILGDKDHLELTVRHSGMLALAVHIYCDAVPAMFNNLPLVMHLATSSRPPSSAVCSPRPRVESDPVLIQKLRGEASIQFEADVLAPDTLWIQQNRLSSLSSAENGNGENAGEASSQDSLKTVLQSPDEPRNPFAKIAQWAAARKAAQKMRMPAVWEVRLLLDMAAY